MIQPFSPADDRNLLTETVRAAGEIAARAYHADSAKVWDKGGSHPVTDADIAVNDYLSEVLQKARPDYGWLSEETKDDLSRHRQKRCFVVDPIDGTRAFIDRKPGFAVSVAVIEDGQPIAGAVYNPLKDEMYTAHIEGGATLNAQTLSVSDKDEIEGCRMVGYPRKFKRLGWPAMDVSICNSMAYRIVRVASGQDHATVAFTPKSDWDIAAAHLIATEAGAVITNLWGQTPRYNQDSLSGFGVICAGPQLHALLKGRLYSVMQQFEVSTDRKRDFGFLGTRMSDRTPDIQLLHIVMGGELVDLKCTEFKDLSKMDFVGAYPNYAEARDAWKSAAQRTVDNAHMRYFILHAHELIDPDKDGIIG